MTELEASVIKAADAFAAVWLNERPYQEYSGLVKEIRAAVKACNCTPMSSDLPVVSTAFAICQVWDRGRSINDWNKLIAQLMEEVKEYRRGNPPV